MNSNFSENLLKKTISIFSFPISVDKKSPSYNCKLKYNLNILQSHIYYV